MDQYANLLTYSCIYTLRSRWQWTEKFVAWKRARNLPVPF